MINRSLAASVAAIAIVASAPAPAWAQERTYSFNIPAGDLGAGIRDFAKESRQQVSFDGALVAGKHGNEVKGNYPPEQALTRLLDGTGITFRQADRGVFILSAVGNASGAGETAPSSGEAAAVGKASAEQEAIVVTGTNIRGVQSTALPTKIYTQSEIDHSGLGTVPDLLLRLPENFKGGASEGTFGTILGGGRANNVVGATGVNLRGLGNDATLVLLNGNRIAPNNTFGNFVDVSLIPVSAIERVEVVPDGASAIYGSDAVGGVANFILRSDFDGLESRARYSYGAGGAPRTVDVAETVGRTWDSGSALLSADYENKTPLSVSDRPYTSATPAPLPFYLLPPQKQVSGLLNLRESPTPGLDLFATATIAHRRTNSRYSFAFPGLVGGQATPAQETAGTVSMGGSKALGGDWVASVSINASESRTNAQVENILNGVTTTPNNQHVVSSIWSIDPKLTGSLLTLPAGELKVAAGLQFRKERFIQNDQVVGSRFRRSRQIGAVFAELRAPLLAGVNENPALELSLGDRFERYSDFGQTNNPLLGLIGRPLSGLRVRATYGTSFRAPHLVDMNPLPTQVAARREADPQTGGLTNVLIIFGGNPNLKPEKAKTWTIGFDYQPVTIPGLRLSASYYNITFKDRIIDAQSSGFDVTNALAIESELGPSIVLRNPSLTQVEAVASNTSLFSDFTAIPGGVNLATIGAIIDSRALNSASVKTRGLDFSISYARSIEHVDMDVGLDGTRIGAFSTRYTPDAPTVTLLNTPYNPVSLRLRGHASAHRGSLTVSTFVNYVGPYKDNRSSPPTHISAFTTFDANLAYEFGSEGKFTAIVGSNNIGNRRPPFVRGNPFFPYLNFDGANASVIGRELFVQLVARW